MSCIILWVIPDRQFPTDITILVTLLLVMPHCISFLFPSWSLHTSYQTLHSALYSVSLYSVCPPFSLLWSTYYKGLCCILSQTYTHPPVIHIFKISAPLQKFYLPAHHITFSPLRAASLRQQHPDGDGFVVRSDSCRKVNLESPPPWRCSW